MSEWLWYIIPDSSQTLKVLTWKLVRSWKKSAVQRSLHRRKSPGGSLYGDLPVSFIFLLREGPCPVVSRGAPPVPQALGRVARTCPTASGLLLRAASQDRAASKSSPDTEQKNCHDPEDHNLWAAWGPAQQAAVKETYIVCSTWYPLQCRELLYCCCISSIRLAPTGIGECKGSYKEILGRYDPAPRCGWYGP